MIARSRIEKEDEPVRLTQEADQARFRLEVTRQRVRISKTQLERARDLYKEAKREAKRARRKAANAQRKWKVVRKRVGRKTASAAKLKAKRTAGLRTTARRRPAKHGSRARRTRR